MGLILMAIVVLAGIVILSTQFHKIPLYWYPALFYIFKFIGVRFLDFERVRYSMVYQIAVIGILLFLAWRMFGYPKKAKGTFATNNFRIIIYFLILICLFICYGLLIGNSKMQVLIDSYKFLEMLVYFILFWFTWRTMEDVNRGLTALYVVMLCMGIAEIFMTDRGGVGLNLCISLVPFMLAVGMQEKENRTTLFASLVVTLLIVFTCQTRTYIISFVVGIFAMILFIGPRARFRLISSLAIITTIFLLVFAFTGIDLFSQTLERFSELSGGFEEAGGYRSAELNVLFSKVSESPYLGAGLGYLERLYISGMGYIEWGSFVHNAYAELLLKVGGIGVVLLAGLLFLYLGNLVSGVRECTEAFPIVRRYLLGAFIALISWVVIFFAAPTTTFGCMFIGPIICTVSLYCASRDFAVDPKRISKI